MSTTLDQLKATLAELPAPIRAELAQYLLHSLDTEEEGTKAEWLASAQKRIADLRADLVKVIPAEEVLETPLDPER